MGGGKETPRQKMVGMMYLVLTALLALNVSKSILDAFVAIEENTQKSAIVQLDRGDVFVKDLKGLVESNKKENPGKAAKCLYYLEMITKIDKQTADIIKFIDEIKIDIMKKSGETTAETEKMNDKETILWKKYNPKDGLRPARLNLMAVNAKDQYDVPMHEIIGEEINNPSPEKSGLKLWKKYNDYRAMIVETLGTYHKSIDSISGKGIGNPTYVVKTKPINAFKDNLDLNKKVDDMLKATQLNKEDIGVLKQLYMELTKQERFEEVNDVKNVHWIGKTFDHSPLVAALASLTAMQLEVLNARATAAGYLAGKVGSAQYSFNKLVALADGPGTVADGESFEIRVVVGAYDSDNTPEATGGSFTYQDGMAIMKATGSGEDMTYKGTIAIKDRSGAKKELDWEKKIAVIKGSTTAAIMCEDIQVVYAGISMNFKAQASGMYKSVTCNPSTVNASISQIGSKITVRATGVGKDGKSVGLGEQSYTVKACPKPELKWNGIAEGGRALKSAGTLTCAFGDNVPFSPTKGSFQVVSYIITVSGIKGSLEGPGSTISAAHLNAIKGVGAGSCAISVKYSGTASGRVSATFTL
jgi:hypothetical protein